MSSSEGERTREFAKEERNGEGESVKDGKEAERGLKSRNALTSET